MRGARNLPTRFLNFHPVPLVDQNCRREQPESIGIYKIQQLGITLQSEPSLNFILIMWTITLLHDPLNIPVTIATTGTSTGCSESAVPLEQHKQPQQQTRIAVCTCPISDLVGLDNASIVMAAVQQQQPQCQRAARIALADYVARMIAVRSLFLQEQPLQHQVMTTTNDSSCISTRIEPLDRATSVTNSSSSSSIRRQPKRQLLSTRSHTGSKSGNSNEDRTDSLKHITPATTTVKNSIPYILERSDVTMTPVGTKNDGNNDEYQIHIYVRVYVDTDTVDAAKNDKDDTISIIKRSVANWMQQMLDFNSSVDSMKDLMTHIAIVILQEKLRSELRRQDATTAEGQEMSGGGVAFIADGAILPRKSGASSMPMSSPPAIPFMAPEHSTMHRTLQIEMGPLAQYLKDCLPSGSKIIDPTNIIAISGLLIPRGVSLIVGGGYHGKSTLLRCIAAGVYNKVIGDGREFCVTLPDALMVRAEDGRYVHNCNVSAFISNLPIPNVDTKHFSTKEASGSTSQASNVVEAIEMGVSAMLIDEDVSAANFMARDGRMRSLVMDESITPLLYRVNGLFRSHGISSIVVVGGVGDWLDVPDNVILLDRYICYDATAKARSISKQFSHGHVQYAGRGVVHRLNWDKGGTPLPRRPKAPNNSNYNILTTGVTLLDGSNSIALHTIYQSHHNGTDAKCLESDADENDDNDDERYIDMSRCEQLLGKKPELYGCGLCVSWLLCYSQQHPELGVNELLQKMDEVFDQHGWTGSIQGCHPNESDDSDAWRAIVECLGFVYRPRRLEVGQALTRFRGITFVDIPIDDDGSDEAARVEAERQRNELLAIWNNRRKKNLD